MQALKELEKINRVILKYYQGITTIETVSYETKKLLLERKDEIELVLNKILKEKAIKEKQQPIKVFNLNEKTHTNKGE